MLNCFLIKPVLKFTCPICILVKIAKFLLYLAPLSPSSSQFTLFSWTTCIAHRYSFKFLYAFLAYVYTAIVVNVDMCIRSLCLRKIIYLKSFLCAFICLGRSFRAAFRACLLFLKLFGLLRCLLVLLAGMMVCSLKWQWCL